ncbi:hypothetical protein MRX96_002463 [Rhipicephalus microplus]
MLAVKKRLTHSCWGQSARVRTGSSRASKSPNATLTLLPLLGHLSIRVAEQTGDCRRTNRREVRLAPAIIGGGDSFPRLDFFTRQITASPIEEGNGRNSAARVPVCALQRPRLIYGGSSSPPDASSRTTTIARGNETLSRLDARSIGCRRNLARVVWQW